MTQKPKALFIGRFQPFHNGHKWLIDQKLQFGIPVIVAVRNILPDENNPLTADKVIELIRRVYKNNDVEAFVLPDIESINYGRGVGYEINCFEPPENIGRVSATQIRDQISRGDSSWEQYVPEEIVDILREELT